MAKLIPFPSSSEAEAKSSGVIASTARLTDGLFVGRERELSILQSALDDALSGQGRLVLLVGEPGIGKTRTAHELAAVARHRKARVLVGRCSESAGAPPLWPWIQIVRSYIASSHHETLRAALGAGAADIAYVITDVHQQLPDLPIPSLLQPQHARFRFFDSFTTFLKNIAKAQPLVLILDDLLWADTSSLLLLQFVAREFAETALLIIGTYRDVDVGMQHPLTQTLGDLVRVPGSQSLVLSGLSAQDVARFLALATGSAPADATVVAVHQKTEGNPFFLTEVVRQLMSDTSQLALAASQTHIGLPHRVREAITRRLQTLSAACHQLLTTAAVIGREFSLTLLEGATLPPLATTTATLIDTLDEAVAARLIATVPNSAGLYVFSHALIRETLYEALSTAQRIRLHGQVGTALEVLHAADQDPYVAECAYHFFQAAPQDAGEKALVYAQRAGTHAMKLLAYEEAVGHYEQGLQVLELLRPHDSQRCELLLGLGDALWHSGDSLRAREQFIQAAQVAQQVGAAEVLARAVIGLGNVRAETGVIDDVLVKLSEATLVALGSQDSTLRARVMARLAIALYYDPTAAQRRERLSTEALAMAERVSDPGALAFALIARHFVIWGLGSMTERLALATEAVRCAQEASDLALTLEGLAWRILALFEQGDIPAVDREIDNYARWSARVRLPRSQWYLTLVRSARAFLDGQFVVGEQLATEAASVPGEANDQANAVMIFGAQLFTVRREQGRMAELEPILTGFAQQFAALPIWRCSVATFYCEVGNYAAAQREFLSLAEQTFAAIPYDANRPPSLALLAEACNMLNDAQHAAQLYQFLLPYAEQNIVVGTSAIAYGPTTRYLGLLATTMARWEEATRHFATALAMSEKMGARPWIAHIHFDHARMRFARNDADDPEQAMRLLDLARRAAQELGMNDLEEKIKNLTISHQRSAVSMQHEEGALQQFSSRRQSLAPRTHSLKPLAASFCCEGEYWAITYQTNTVRLKDLRGLQYLAFLLRYPHQEFHSLELATLATPDVHNARPSELAHLSVSRPRDAGDLLDAHARSAYRRRLEELRVEVEEARSHNDFGRADNAQRELDFLTAELAKAFGLHGRSRKVAAQTERARVSVTRRITVARQKIAALNPALERYLGLTIKTGVFCSFTPHPDFPVEWHF